MAGGSKFTRTMQYFREADLDEVDAAIAKAHAIVAERQKAARALRAGIAGTPQRKRRAARKPAAAPSAHTAAAGSQNEQARAEWAEGV